MHNSLNSRWVCQLSLATIVLCCSWSSCFSSVWQQAFITHISDDQWGGSADLVHSSVNWSGLAFNRRLRPLSSITHSSGLPSGSQWCENKYTELLGTLAQKWHHFMSMAFHVCWFKLVIRSQGEWETKPASSVRRTAKPHIRSLGYRQTERICRPKRYTESIILRSSPSSNSSQDLGLAQKTYFY